MWPFLLLTPIPWARTSKNSAGVHETLSGAGGGNSPSSTYFVAAEVLEASARAVRATRPATSQGKRGERRWLAALQAETEFGAPIGNLPILLSSHLSPFPFPPVVAGPWMRTGVSVIRRAMASRLSLRPSEHGRPPSGWRPTFLRPGDMRTQSDHGVKRLFCSLGPRYVGIPLHSAENAP